MPEQNPTQTPPTTPEQPADPPNGGPDPKPGTSPQPPVEAGKQPPWGKPENFDADKAWELIQNLRTEKGDDALRQQVTAMQEAQEEQRRKLAAALGLTEAPKDEDDLAETVKSLQEQFAASQLDATKLRIAAEKNIPAEYHDLLTETDPEKLSAQAEKVGALVAAQANPEQPPAFQANPGQGRGGQGDPKAAEDADYERYYPTPNRS